MFKLMLIPRNREGLDRAGLQHHLEHVHGPLCMRVPDVRDRFRRYVHHYALDGATDPLLGKPILAGRDALTTIFFDDAAAMRACTSSPGYLAEVRPDEANFASAEGTLGMPVREAVVRDGGMAGTKLFHLRRLRDAGDHDAAAARWIAAVAESLGDGALPGIGRYVVNVALAGPDGTRPPYDIIDEIWLLDQAPFDPAAAAALTEAGEGLFAADQTAAMLTRQRVFIP